MSTIAGSAGNRNHPHRRILGDGFGSPRARPRRVSRRHPHAVARRDDGAPVPGVVIAHGFAGSKQLMLGYGYTLAHAGYATILFDFNGHGANPAPLERDALRPEHRRGGRATGRAAGGGREPPGAARALDGQRRGDDRGDQRTRPVLGSRRDLPDRRRCAARCARQPAAPGRQPRAPVRRERRATAGAGRRAERRLCGPARPRSARRAPTPSTSRSSSATRAIAAALEWIGRALAARDDRPYVDRRILWYGVAPGRVGCWSWSPSRPSCGATWPSLNETPLRRRMAGLLLGAAAATVVVGSLARFTGAVGHARHPGRRRGGALVADCRAGLACLQPADSPPCARGHPARASSSSSFWSWRSASWRKVVWVQWWPIPARLWRWPILALACLPWFLAAGYSQWGAGGWGRLLWWLGQSVVFLAGLFVTFMLAPSLGFLVLLMPILPLIFLVAGRGAPRPSTVPGPMPSARAFFFGWMISVVFPARVASLRRTRTRRRKDAAKDPGRRMIVYRKA